MIEIIKHGTKKKITCPNCGCYFSYEIEDIQRESSKYTGYQPAIEYLVCPEKNCGEKIYINGCPR